jgi:hypothetical protein
VYWDDHHPLRASYKRQYRSAIFYADAAERALAEETKQKVEVAVGKRVFVDIEPLGTFYRAEDYHQTWFARRATRGVALAWVIGSRSAYHRAHRATKGWGRGGMRDLRAPSGVVARGKDRPLARASGEQIG